MGAPAVSLLIDKIEGVSITYNLVRVYIVALQILPFALGVRIIFSSTTIFHLLQLQN